MKNKLLFGAFLSVIAISNFLTSKSLAQSISIKNSEDFTLIYSQNLVSENLAQTFLKTLEYGRSKILDWGFKEPSFMKDKKFSIFLIPQDKMLGKLGTFHGAEEPFIDLAIEKNMPLREYKATLFHELFHAFQHGYIDIKNKWFAEATADAMMDELLITLHEIPEYIVAKDRDEFIFSWHLHDFDSLEGNHEYTSSIFFSYLIHEFKKGPYQGTDIIKAIWKAQPLYGEKPYPILTKVLGGEKKFQEALHQFAVALVTGSTGKSPFGFSDPGIPVLPAITKAIVTELMKDKKGYIVHFDPQTGILLPKIVTLAPYAVQYFNFISKKTEVLKDPLTISLNRKNTDILSDAVLLETEDQTRLFSPDKDLIHIPSFSTPDTLQEAILVVTNPSPEKPVFGFTGVYGNLPYVARVKVFDVEKKKFIYDTFWNQLPSQPHTRNREEILNQLDTDNRKTIKLSFEVLFSRKVTNPKLTIQDKSYTLKKTKNEGLSGFTYKTDKPIPLSIAGQKTVPFYFEAQDEKENNLDSNPATAPLLETLEWKNYENESSNTPAIGGKDQQHKLKIKGETEEKKEPEKETDIRDKDHSGVVTSPEEGITTPPPSQKTNFCWQLRLALQSESEKIRVHQNKIAEEKWKAWNTPLYPKLAKEYSNTGKQWSCLRNLEVTLGYIQYNVMDKTQCHKDRQITNQLTNTPNCPDLCEYSQKECQETLLRFPNFLNEVLKKFN